MKNATTTPENFSTEIENLTISGISEKSTPMPIEYEMSGDFWGLLDRLNVSLAVTREYEHFLMFMGGNGGQPWQNPMMLPHPSGIFYDQPRERLLVSSTRTPNQIIAMKAFDESNYNSEIVPDDLGPPDGKLFIPVSAHMLPGTLYIHDLVMIGQQIYVTVTGHNFLARIDDKGWTRVWWPEIVEGLGAEAFRTNYLQLNSIAVGNSPEESFYTAFADDISAGKPWKQGYGPDKRGVVYSGKTRRPIYRGLTCPHAAKLHGDQIWLCNSGYGEVGYLDNLGGESANWTVVARLPGFTRGLTLVDGYAVVGLSKVIPKYEPYAPGLKPADTRCGIGIVNMKTGATEALLWWPDGYQIYDVQAMPGVVRPQLPTKPPGSEDINRSLRFLG
jgi:uncharacterized protein (TIGR03032 family)